MPGTNTDELEFHASGFVVKVHGFWTDKALAQFRRFLRLRRLAATDEAFTAALTRAKQKYLEGSGCVCVCAAKPCRDKIAFDISPEAVESAAADSGMRILLTGCQGPCKQAPVVALRISASREFFAQVTSAADWRSILAFAGRASRAGTLMIDAGNAESFRFDPVHDCLKPSVHLAPLQFLIGHFRGQGRYTMTPYVFQKEVIGTPEAGGRFIALRMGVSYPLDDGRIDVHKALVMVGAQPAHDRYIAHAYTDAGIFREYAVQGNEAGLSFADLPPGHSEQWRRARKVLRPTSLGFEEQLEVDDGGGFVPYYVISMERLAGN